MNIVRGVVPATAGDTIWTERRAMMDAVPILVNMFAGYGMANIEIETDGYLTEADRQALRDIKGVVRATVLKRKVMLSFGTTYDFNEVAANVLVKVVELLEIPCEDADIRLSPSYQDKGNDERLAAIIAQMKSGQAEAGHHSFYDGGVHQRGDERVTFVRHAD